MVFVVETIRFFCDGSIVFYRIDHSYWWLKALEISQNL